MKLCLNLIGRLIKYVKMENHIVDVLLYKRICMIFI
jgi:hypothetical protein